MEKMVESYRETMGRLKERSRELERQMAALLPGVERDVLEARNRVLQQEIREMGSVVAMMTDYLDAGDGRGEACRVSALAPQRRAGREEAVS